MSIRDELKAELRDAMKARDRRRRDAIRQIETEVSLRRSAPGFAGRVDDDFYRTVIRSYVKKMHKAREEYEAAGERGKEQADKLAYEVGYLSQWLPEPLDESATRALVRKAVAELGADDAKMAGRVIGQVMKSGEELDGSLVARIVGEELA